MKRGEKTLICVLAGLSLVGPANAVSDPAINPYTGIVDRNVFGLKPPPPPPDPEANKPPPPPITLTGITTILGNKRALMKTAATAPKPGEMAKEQSYILTIGQREGDIEVLDIDEKVGSVKVRYAGNESTLTFEKNGPKIAATPPPAAMPGIPAPAGAIPAPMAMPGGATPTPMPSFGTPTPGVTRPLRMPGVGSGSPQASVGVSGATMTSGGVALPSFGSSPVPTAVQPQNSTSQMSLEEQEIMIEAHHAVAVAKGDPVANIFPPTQISPTRNTALGSTGNAEAPVPGQATPPQPQVPRPLPGQPLPLPFPQ